MTQLDPNDLQERARGAWSTASKMSVGRQGLATAPEQDPLHGRICACTGCDFRNGVARAFGEPVAHRSGGPSKSMWWVGPVSHCTLTLPLPIDHWGNAESAKNNGRHDVLETGLRPHANSKQRGGRVIGSLCSQGHRSYSATAATPTTHSEPRSWLCDYGHHRWQRASPPVPSVRFRRAGTKLIRPLWTKVSEWSGWESSVFLPRKCVRLCSGFEVKPITNAPQNLSRCPRYEASTCLRPSLIRLY